MSAERGGSDISRHWRLKTARSQIVATRLPDGTVVIPSSTLSTRTSTNERYCFNQDGSKEPNKSRDKSTIKYQASVLEAAD